MKPAHIVDVNDCLRTDPIEKDDSLLRRLQMVYSMTYDTV